MFLYPTAPAEIECILNALPTKKSVGTDSIPAVILELPQKLFRRTWAHCKYIRFL